MTTVIAATIIATAATAPTAAAAPWTPKCQAMFTQFGTCLKWAKAIEAAAAALGPCDDAHHNSTGELCGYKYVGNTTYHSGHELIFTHANPAKRRATQAVTFKMFDTSRPPQGVCATYFLCILDSMTTTSLSRIPHACSELRDRRTEP